jgi:2-polyprenyl-3-methyl-5-hydroxy-6-metoxy-1,4-benzoquinol methylase
MQLKMIHEMEIIEFYNRFQKRLLTNYIEGNIRVITALTEVLKRIPKDAIKILDIGCGIGWSSHMISSNFPDKQITAIDLSNELIYIADKLFSAPNVFFHQLDVTKDDLTKYGIFDLIIMIDVFEHISKEDRPEFEKKISQLLSENGSIFFSCPTIFHQNYLKLNQPDGIQPVDEDITLDIIMDFSKIIGGQIIYFEFRNIWRTNDYFHCMIRKNPDYSLKKEHEQNYYFESKSERIRRVLNSEFIQLFTNEELQQLSNYSIDKERFGIRQKIKELFKF